MSKGMPPSHGHKHVHPQVFDVLRNHPKLTHPNVIQAAGLDGDDWFIRRDARIQAATAAEEAAAIGASAGAALRRYIDSERIEWLAALDGDTLRFMADIEERQYSQDVLIKWVGYFAGVLGGVIVGRICGFGWGHPQVHGGH